MSGHPVPVEPAAAAPAPPAPWRIEERWRAEFRRLRDALRAAAPMPACLAVTSTTSGEGVSSVAAGLACAFAEDLARVRLVDLAASGALDQLRRFGLDTVPAEVLHGVANVSARVRSTSWPSLSVVSIEGGGPLAGATLRPALAQWREGVDAVVLDAPPVSASGAVLQLGPAVDGVVIVIEAERERRDAIARASLDLERAGLRVLGAVLNRRRRHVPAALDRLL